MKRQLLFIHSAGAQGEHQGSSYLVADLQSRLGADYELISPNMPNPEDPSYAQWKAELARILRELRGELILVGHSLGGSVLLKYLSEEPFDQPIAGLFTVAAPYWGRDGWDIEEFTLQEDFPTKFPGKPLIFIYHSRDDEVVPFEHVGSYAAKLDWATVRRLDGYGHAFSSGCLELVDDIKRLQGVSGSVSSA